MLNQTFVSNLKKHKLHIGTKMRGLHKGSRQSNQFGSSLDFSDYQEYQLGDDVRQIDWNVYARTHKHYVKRFLDERELTIAVYLDGSPSMYTEESKWVRARQLAAAFCFLILSNEDRVIFQHIEGSRSQKLSKRGSNEAKAIMYDIQNLKYKEFANEKYNFFYNLNKNVVNHSQAAIIISDGLQPLEEINESLKRISVQKGFFYFVQLLSSEERSPSLLGDFRLIDSEYSNEVNVSIDQKSISRYKFRLQQHNEELKKLTERWGGTFIEVSDQESMNQLFFQTFKERGLLSMR